MCALSCSCHDYVAGVQKYHYIYARDVAAVIAWTSWLDRSLVNSIQILERFLSAWFQDGYAGTRLMSQLEV